MDHFYDAVDYPGYAWSNAHPDRMAVMARLHGLQPAPIENCRVLDVGCNDGANLIPLAYAIPGSQFVGFDIAAAPIARAQQRIDKLGLTNARVLQADLSQLPEDLGTFDYIIAHGVYAWVPDFVRDALLALYRKHLSPNGIAFTSYNALPGSYIRMLTRDVLLNRVAKAAHPFQGMAAGVGLLELIAQLRPENDLLGALLASEASKIRERKPQLVFHDELVSTYRPVSFSSFASHAADNELSFVSESSLEPIGDPAYDERAARIADGLSNGSRIEEEQLLDYMRIRSYRETLLCHSTLKPKANLQLNALRHMRFASAALSAQSNTPNARTYISSIGTETQITEARTIALLDFLIARCPHGVSFEGLLTHLAQEPTLNEADFLPSLIELAASRLIEVHTWDAPVSDGISEYPRASAITRMEAATHDVMTTLHHHPMKIDGMVKELVALLDGTRNHASLAAAIRDLHPEITETAALKGTEAALQLLYRGGILVADNFRNP